MRSPLRSWSITVALLLPCLLGAGCAQVVKSLREISKLQAAIVKEFGDKDVNVNLSNGDTLIITFINSPLNDKSPEERAKRAEQTAELVKQNYPTNQVDEIWVTFIRSHTRFIVVNYTESLGFFGFDKDGRPLRSPEPEPPTEPASPTSEFGPSMQATAVYSPERKQTDVVIGRLQLEGDLNNGLVLLTHFTVPGDATGVKRSSSYPTIVSFDFSSYSEKSMFPGAPKITFLVDGKVAFETSEQFSTSKYGEQFSEYLSLGIPYPAFRRMTAGKKLTLRIGDREYEFTGEQLAALREMTQYVKD
jgi:hypothetical protein